MPIQHYTRRTALNALGAGTAVLAGSRPGLAVNSGPVIEWNQHMFSRDTGRFPFNPKAPYTPDFTKFPSDPLVPYLQRLEQERIDRAVFVQPEPYGDDHRLMLDCLARTSPERFRGTSLFYPKDVQAPQKLTDLVRNNPRIVSTRFHAHRGKEMYLDSFADDGVRALWKRAVDLGLVIELHIGPNYALQVADIIRAFPGCKVIIDHLAEAKRGTPIEYANVLDLAQLPHVYMKLSELENIADDPPLFESILPFTRRVIREFGPTRMIWSGGATKIADVHFEGYSVADLAKVKGGNLRELLDW
jgi:predicted TIM-barrel fold metal-dependent hydrolase